MTLEIVKYAGSLVNRSRTWADLEPGVEHPSHDGEIEVPAVRINEGVLHLISLAKREQPARCCLVSKKNFVAAFYVLGAAREKLFPDRYARVDKPAPAF